MRDGAISLIDKRTGQTKDYHITTQIKSEIIQQLAIDVIMGEPSSSSAISNQLQERCQIAIPSRTVRHHINKLGLSQLKQSLPRLIADGKKNSKHGA
jgi:hypothetical protein